MLRYGLVEDSGASPLVPANTRRLPSAQISLLSLSIIILIVISTLLLWEQTPDGDSGCGSAVPPSLSHFPVFNFPVFQSSCHRIFVPACFLFALLTGRFSMPGCV